jgi:hypothetical protein
MIERLSQSIQTDIYTTFLQSDEISQDDLCERLNATSAKTLYGSARKEHVHTIRGTANAAAECKETNGCQNRRPPTERLSETTAHREERSGSKGVSRANPGELRRV